MPRGDRTGPRGEGPLTGRGLGNCGQGIGFRRGSRYADMVNLSKEEQKRVLEAELKDIEAEKQELKRKLNEL